MFACIPELVRQLHNAEAGSHGYFPTVNGPTSSRVASSNHLVVHVQRSEKIAGHLLYNNVTAPRRCSKT